MTEIWFISLRSAMDTILDFPRENFNSSPALFHLWGTDLPTKKFSLIQVFKVAAITGMPTPVDKAAMQRFSWMCQYLYKFCQYLSQTVLPLRALTRNDTEFLWWDVHKVAFNSAKSLIGLTQQRCIWQRHRRSLTSGGHPVCLLHVTHTQRYRKKLCSDQEIVLGNCVLYGEMASLPIWKAGHNGPFRSSALETIFKKPLSRAPHRLQRMMLRTITLLFSTRKGKGSSWPTLCLARLSVMDPERRKSTMYFVWISHRWTCHQTLSDPVQWIRSERTLWKTHP